MVRRTGLALAWLGLSTATMVLSLSACFVDVTQGRVGECEDDSNPCTKDTCEAGATQHQSEPAGTKCSLGDNPGKCNGMSGMDRCVLDCESDPQSCSCTVDTQCPKDEDCADWGCVAGKCMRAPANEGVQVGTQVEDDCKQVVCQGGEYATVADMADPPPSDDCIVKSCDAAGAVVETPADLGKDCNSGTNECNGKGECVTCFSAGELNSCGMDCKVKLCNGETAIDGASCQSGNVADGVCCDTTCTQVCKSCNAMGTAGTCSDIGYYQTDPYYIPEGGGSAASCDPATAGALCDGKGKCLKTVMQSCLIGENCLSGKCSAAMKCLGAPGEICLTGADCVSGMCMATCK